MSGPSHVLHLAWAVVKPAPESGPGQALFGRRFSLCFFIADERKLILALLFCQTFGGGLGALLYDEFIAVRCNPLQLVEHAARTGRDQTANDDVLFQALQRIHLATA